MAKTEGEGKDDYEFVPPDFDEDAFIHSEMLAFRATIAIILWALAAALVSLAAFWLLDGKPVGWPLGLGILLGFALVIKPVLKQAKVDHSSYTKGKWFGTYFMLFVTWLSFFIVLVNPPVGDFAPPQVGLVASPAIQQAGGAVTFDLVASDNSHLDATTFKLTDATGKVLADQAGLKPIGEQGARLGHQQYVATGLPAGKYTASATASDRRGHDTTTMVNVTVASTVLQFFPDDLSAPQEAVAVKVTGLEPCSDQSVGYTACIRTVYLVGDGTNVTLEYHSDHGAWEASQNYAGWKSGVNNVTVVAEQGDQFFGAERFRGTHLTLPGSFQFNVTLPGGDPHHVHVPANPDQPVRSVPGLGPGVLAVGVLALAFAVRRRN